MFSLTRQLNLLPFNKFPSTFLRQAKRYNEISELISFYYEFKNELPLLKEKKWSDLSDSQKRYGVTPEELVKIRIDEKLDSEKLDEIFLFFKKCCLTTHSDEMRSALVLFLENNTHLKIENRVVEENYFSEEFVKDHLISYLNKIITPFEEQNNFIEKYNSLIKEDLSKWMHPAHFDKLIHYLGGNTQENVLFAHRAIHLRVEGFLGLEAYEVARKLNELILEKNIFKGVDKGINGNLDELKKIKALDLSIAKIRKHLMRIRETQKNCLELYKAKNNFFEEGKDFQFIADPVIREYLPMVYEAFKELLKKYSLEEALTRFSQLNTLKQQNQLQKFALSKKDLQICKAWTIYIKYFGWESGVEKSMEINKENLGFKTYLKTIDE